jgi:hypothetical protein
MASDPNPHARAVALFEALLKAPVARHCRRPGDVADSLGRATSTGYRVVAEAEATGLLQRDLNQAYRRGLLARRIGFSALGFGAIADVAEPLLTDLREALRLTTLFGVAREGRLLVGPYSLGRGPGYVRPAPAYRVTEPMPAGTLETLALLPEASQGQTVHARALVVERTATATCLLAVLSMHPIQGPVPVVDTALGALESRLSDWRAP